MRNIILFMKYIIFENEKVIKKYVIKKIAKTRIYFYYHLNKTRVSINQIIIYKTPFTIVINLLYVFKCYNINFILIYHIIIFDNEY